MAIAIRSASASIRLHEARTFLDTFSPGTEVLLLGASRGARRAEAERQSATGGGSPPQGVGTPARTLSPAAPKCVPWFRFRNTGGGCYDSGY